MTDLVKGIIIGVIAVKIIESDTVQNYIHKKIRKKCHDLGTKIADAILPVEEEEKTSDLNKSILKSETHCFIDKEGKPCKTSDIITLFDAKGNPFYINKKAVLQL